MMMMKIVLTVMAAITIYFITEHLPKRKKGQKNSQIIRQYQGKSFIDKDDEIEYTGIVIDVVIETTSGDLCFEYNIVSGGVREDVSKYIIVVEYATSANCVWLDLVVTGNEVGAENSNNQYGVDMQFCQKESLKREAHLMRCEQ